MIMSKKLNWYCIVDEKDNLIRLFSEKFDQERSNFFCSRQLPRPKGLWLVAQS